MFKDVIFPAPPITHKPVSPLFFFVPPVHGASLLSSPASNSAAQPDLPGGSDLLRWILLRLRNGSDRCGGQDAQFSQEERLQQPNGRAQAGQEHPSAQTGNRK